MLTTEPCPLVPHPHALHTPRDGNSATSLSSLFLLLNALSMKKIFLIPNLNLSWYNLMPFPPVLSLVTWKKSLTLTLLQPPLRCFWTCSCTSSVSCHEGPKTEHRVWGAAPPASSTGVKNTSLKRWSWQGVEQLKASTEDQRKKGSTFMRYTILFLTENFTPWRGLHLIGKGARDISSVTPSRYLPHCWCPAQAICFDWDEWHHTLPLTLLFIDFPKPVQVSCMLFPLPKNRFFLKQSLHIVQISAKSFLKIEVAAYCDVQISRQRWSEYRNQRCGVMEGSCQATMDPVTTVCKHSQAWGKTRLDNPLRTKDHVVQVSPAWLFFIHLTECKRLQGLSDLKWAESVMVLK